jgi:ribokinase
MPEIMHEPFDYAFLGGMGHDYVITREDRIHIELLGGNAVYSAAGAGVWTRSVGVICRAGGDASEGNLQQMEACGIDTSGVTVLQDQSTPIYFYAYMEDDRRIDRDPAPQFLRLGQPLPKPLIGFRPSSKADSGDDRFAPFSLRPGDLPERLARCKGVHLAPAQFLTHLSLPVRLREMRIPLITLAPSEGYLEPAYLEELPLMLTGIDVFLPNEAHARALFSPMRPSIWDIAEEFAGMGARLVVIRCGQRGYYLYDPSCSERWTVPSYPTRISDPTGMGSAFCGGFLVGFECTGDLVEAALMGSVSASISVEGSGPLYALDSLPGLAQARLDALRRRVIRA